MANVQLKVTANIEIGNKDHVLVVHATDNTKLGELHFSKGSVEWWPNGKKVNAHKYTWAQFAKALESVKAPKHVAKPAAKKKSPIAAAPTAKPATKRALKSKKV